MDPNTASAPFATIQHPQLVYLMAAPGQPIAYPMYPIPAQAGNSMPIPAGAMILPAAPPPLSHSSPASMLLPGDATPVVKETLTIRQRLEQRDFNPDLAKWINTAWTLYKVNYNWLKLLVWTCIAIAVCFIPFAGGLVIYIPMQVGLIVAVLNAIRTTSAHPNDIQLRDLIPNLKLALFCLVLTLLHGIFIALGFILLILPGIYLCFALTYALPLYIEFRELGLSIMDSFKVSNTQFKKRLGSMVVWALALNGIIVMGILALGVGVLVSMPVALLAFTVAINDLFGLRDIHEYEMGVSMKL